MKNEIKINRIKVTTRKQLDKLYNCSALTVIGLQDSDEELKAFGKWIQCRTKISQPLPIYIIKGKTMNEEYGLTKENAYPEEINLISVDLNDIEMGSKIILERFSIGGRLFDDIVNNNKLRQNEIDEIEDDEEEY